MDKVGGEAARLVKAAVSSKASKPGRKGKQPAPVADPPEPAPTFVETNDASVASGIEAFPTTMVPEADITAPAVPQVEHFETMVEAATPARDLLEPNADRIPAGISDSVDVPSPGGEVHPIEALVPVEDHRVDERNEPVPATASAMLDGGETVSEDVTRDAVAIVETGSEDAVMAREALAQDVGTVAEIVADAATDGGAVITHLAADVAGTGSASSGDADAMRELGEKVARRIQGNIDASIAFWISMMQVKSPAEAIELNTAHLRHQMKSFVSQCEDLGGLARGPWMFPWRLWTGDEADRR